MIRPTRNRAFFATTALFLAGAVTGQITLATQADATVRSDRPTANFGTSPELGMGKDRNASLSTFFMRTYFRIDITPLIGKPITNATLHFHETRTLGPGGQEVAVFRLTQPFVESTVTWNSKPTEDGTPITRVVIGDNRNTGWKSFDVTALVADWVQGRAPNHGLVVRLEQETATGPWHPGFGPSREFATVTERPVLSVDVSGVRIFDMGCGPVATWPHMWVLNGTPKIGTAMAVGGNLLSPNTLGMTAIGLSNTNWRGLPLPFIIDPIPGPACKLLVAPDALVFGNTDINGNLALRFTIPNDPRLISTRVYIQMATSSPLHMTEGLELVIH